MLELKLMDENKTKRAAIILKKNFDSDTVSISEENNVLHIEDEIQGVKVTNVLFNLQQPTKKMDVEKYSKILSEFDIAANLVYNTHAKKLLDEFYSEEEEEQTTRKQKKNKQHEQPKFSSIERILNIFFTKFSGFEFISQLENCLLVFDDSFEEI